MRVLHVTECEGGGVTRAVRSRIAATPEVEHHLLWSGDDDTGPALGAVDHRFTSSGILARSREVAALVDKLSPDLVHAHSSWAGVYARVRAVSAPVIYEPHCFKFVDPQLHPMVRAGLRLSEKILGARTAAYATLTQHEATLAAALGGTDTVVIVPNTPTVPVAIHVTEPRRRSIIAMVGRLSRQKDPEFFLEVVHELGQGSDLKPVWVGDGDRRYAALLRDHGVTVTGWVGGGDLRRALNDAVYVHTAAYEGFPLSVLDAAALGAPIVARSIPAFEGTSLIQADSARELALLATDLSLPGEAQRAALAAGGELLRRHSQTALTSGLLNLYGRARSAHRRDQP